MPKIWSACSVCHCCPILHPMNSHSAHSLRPARSIEAAMVRFIQFFCRLLLLPVSQFSCYQKFFSVKSKSSHEVQPEQLSFSFSTIFQNLQNGLAAPISRSSPFKASHSFYFSQFFFLCPTSHPYMTQNIAFAVLTPLQSSSCFELYYQVGHNFLLRSKPPFPWPQSSSADLTQNKSSTPFHWVFPIYFP